MNLDQLTDELNRAATSVELRPGSIATTKATGSRRRYRRRRAGVALTAAATVGATAVGLQQLTRTGPRVATSDVTVPATANPPAAADGLALTPADPALVWRRVDPDSAEAVGQSYDAGFLNPSPALPGVMVSTAPGLADFERTLWRSDDGVSWTEVGPLPAGSTTAASWTSGERVYLVGTMPGVAADSVGPVRVSISDDGGTNWRAVELPLDNPGLATLAGSDGVTTSIGSVAGAGDLAMVLVRQRVNVPDWQEFFAPLGIDAEFLNPTPDGVEVWDCDPTISVVATTTVVAPDDGRFVTCGDPTAVTEVIPWSELGDLGATALAAMGPPEQRLMLTLDGSTFTEVPFPADAADHEVTGLYALGDTVVLAAGRPDAATWALWQSADGATWTELPAPSSARITQLGSALVGVPDYGSGSVHLATEGSSWREASLDQLAGPDEHITTNLMASSPSGVTLVADVNQGVRATVDSTPATALPAVLPTTTVIGGDPYGPGRYEILHSVDGVSWSRESVAELLGVSDAEISRVSRVQTAGDSVVVAVNLVPASQDEIPQQVVLVGTPKG